MTIENRVRQIRRPANELFRQIVIFGPGKFRHRNRLIIGKEIQQSVKIPLADRFIETDPDSVVVEKSEIDQGLRRFFEDRTSSPAKLHPKGIKTGTAPDVET